MGTFGQEMKMPMTHLKSHTPTRVALLQELISTLLSDPKLCTYGNRCLVDEIHVVNGSRALSHVAGPFSKVTTCLPHASGAVAAPDPSCWNAVYERYASRDGPDYFAIRSGSCIKSVSASTAKLAIVHDVLVVSEVRSFASNCLIVGADAGYTLAFHIAGSNKTMLKKHISDPAARGAGARRGHIFRMLFLKKPTKKGKGAVGPKYLNESKLWREINNDFDADLDRGFPQPQRLIAAVAVLCGLHEYTTPIAKLSMVNVLKPLRTAIEGGLAFDNLTDQGLNMELFLMIIMIRFHSDSPARPFENFFGGARGQGTIQRILGELKEGKSTYEDMINTCFFPISALQKPSAPETWMVLYASLAEHGKRCLLAFRHTIAVVLHDDSATKPSLARWEEDGTSGFACLPSDQTKPGMKLSSRNLLSVTGVQELLPAAEDEDRRTTTLEEVISQATVKIAAAAAVDDPAAAASAGVAAKRRGRPAGSLSPAPVRALTLQEKELEWMEQAEKAAQAVDEKLSDSNDDSDDDSEGDGEEEGDGEGDGGDVELEEGGGDGDDEEEGPISSIRRSNRTRRPTTYYGDDDDDDYD